MEPARPLRRGNSLGAATAAHLGRLVIEDLVPGDRLPPERVLAAELAVSRATVREALHELERRRLVSRTPGRGTVVLDRPDEAADILDRLSGTPSEREHVAEFRALVEPQVAALAAQRAAEADLVELERVLTATHAGLSADESLARDVAFHVQVARASGNPLFVSLAEASAGWVQDVRAESHRTSEGRRASFEWHRRVLNALHQRDPVAARRAMADHLADVARLVDDADVARLVDDADADRTQPHERTHP